jgi:hypothetical protein
MPVKTGNTPAAAIASCPREACTWNRDRVSVDVLCIQALTAATRSVVSSKCATGAAANCSRTASRNGANPSLVRVITVVRVPTDMPTSSRSARVWQARSYGRCW